MPAPLRKSLFTLAVLTSSALFGFISTQTADARPSTKQFSCQGLKQFIDQRGAVVMDTKNNRVYKRLVKNRSFCELVQSTGRFTVPTTSGTCRVKICRDINPGGGG